MSFPCWRANKQKVKDQRVRSLKKSRERKKVWVQDIQATSREKKKDKIWDKEIQTVSSQRKSQENKEEVYHKEYLTSSCKNQVSH